MFVRDLIQEIRTTRPLIHHLTNYVTVNDCANIVLAIGGSPVMADTEEEVAEMVTLASSLVINKRGKRLRNTIFLLFLILQV